FVVIVRKLFVFGDNVLLSTFDDGLSLTWRQGAPFGGLFADVLSQVRIIITGAANRFRSCALRAAAAGFAGVTFALIGGLCPGARLGLALFWLPGFLIRIGLHVCLLLP